MHVNVAPLVYSKDWCRLNTVDFCAMQAKTKTKPKQKQKQKPNLHSFYTDLGTLNNLHLMIRAL